VWLTREERRGDEEEIPGFKSCQAFLQKSDCVKEKSSLFFLLFLQASTGKRKDPIKCGHSWFTKHKIGELSTIEMGEYSSLMNICQGSEIFVRCYWL
jgi:hypothetical protein